METTAQGKYKNNHIFSSEEGSDKKIKFLKQLCNTRYILTVCLQGTPVIYSFGSYFADTCVDLDNGDVDFIGNTACEDGFPVAPIYPTNCDNDGYDTDDFDAKTMCCLCGGGGN